MTKDIKSVHEPFKIGSFIYLERAKKFLHLYFFLSACAFALQALLPSYFNFKTSEAISARLDDGPWCNPYKQGIGVHCFGDFYYGMQFPNEINPWSGQLNPYPPFATFFYKPFIFVFNHTNQNHISLILYLLLSLACVMFPALHIFKTRKCDSITTISMIVVSITCAPVLMSIDRGNIQTILIPFLYIFSLGVMENSTKKIFISGIFLVLFKPQFALLGLVFLSGREFKKLIMWVVLSSSLSLFAIALYPNNLIKNFDSYLKGLGKFQQYVNPGSLNPANISIANSWSTIERILTTIYPNISTKDPYGRWTFYPLIVTILLLIIVVLSLIILGKYRSRFEILFTILSVSILFTNVSFAYYLLVYLPPLLFIVGDVVAHYSGKNLHFSKSTDDNCFLEIFKNKPIAIFMSLTFFSLFITWGIPWKIFTKLHDSPWSSIGVNWFPGQIFLIIFFILLLFSGVKQKKD